MKDILVLWDNSNSIGTDGFKEKVVPFLKKFIKSPELQVGKHDTNIGFITFSSEAHTKPLLKIGSKTEPDELETWLDGLDYIKRLSGESTYMGKAFKLANDVSKPCVCLAIRHSDWSAHSDCQVREATRRATID